MARGNKNQSYKGAIALALIAAGLWMWKRGSTASDIITANGADNYVTYATPDYQYEIVINNSFSSPSGQKGFEYTIMVPRGDGSGFIDNIYNDSIYAGDPGYTVESGDYVINTTPQNGYVTIFIMDKSNGAIRFQKTVNYQGGLA